MDTSPNIHNLGIDQLSADVRLRLMDEIWDSLPGDAPEELTQELRNELDRRIADADANPSSGIPWKEAMARLRSGQ
jgi:putative addiction module component (TIGR02574 family)